MKDFRLSQYRKLLKDEIPIPKLVIRIAVVGSSLPENNKFIHKIVEHYGVPFNPLPHHCFVFRDVFPNVDCTLYIQPPEKFSRLVRPPYWKRCHGLVILYSLHDDIPPNVALRSTCQLLMRCRACLLATKLHRHLGKNGLKLRGQCRLRMSFNSLQARMNEIFFPIFRYRPRPERISWRLFII